MPGTVLGTNVYNDEQKKTRSCAFLGGERAISKNKQRKKTYTDKGGTPAVGGGAKERHVVFETNKQTHQELRECFPGKSQLRSGLRLGKRPSMSVLRKEVALALVPGLLFVLNKPFILFFK